MYRHLKFSKFSACFCDTKHLQGGHFRKLKAKTL